MTVDTHFYDFMGPNRYHRAIKSVDWDAWLCAAQRFPDLRGILINNHTGLYDSSRYLKKFVAHLRQRWSGIVDLLEVYDYHVAYRVWTRIKLDALIEDASEMVCPFLMESLTCHERSFALTLRFFPVSQDEEVQSDLNDVELFPGFGYDDYRPDSDPEDWASAD